MKKKKRKQSIFDQIINHINSTNKWLMLIMIVLVGWSVLNIVTASTTTSVGRYDYSMFKYFFNHLLMIFIGFGGYFFATMVPTKSYFKLGKVLYFIFFAMIIALFFFAEYHKGALAWLPIPFTGQSIQPSEFYKVVMIVGIAIVFDKHRKEMQNLDLKKVEQSMTPIVKLLALGIVVPAVVLIQKDLGTAVIMLGIFGILFLASEIPFNVKKRLIQFALFMIGVVVIFVLASGRDLLTGVQAGRLDFFNPCSKYETGGYQTCNTLIAVNNGGLFGLGIGKSQQKYSYVPEAHTDSVFAILVEETGLFGATIAFGLYASLLNIIYKVSQGAKTVRGRFIALGVASYIFLHIFINLGGLLAIIPLTGLPLPFFTYGGSYTISLLTSLGLVQRVYIENK
ncbi:MAG: FtsW/RodA/SpoVE family cell cycle protein [Bacilli bacterium]|nr:FtsW/RodA/SpoVE family cell cycle protein [Bacilli bacterium]